MTTKVLEENIGSKISDILHNNIFVDISLRQGNKRKKINKWDYIKLKSFRTGKEIISKMKRQSTKWENLYTNDTTHKGLISKVYKVLIQQLNTKETIQIFF